MIVIAVELTPGNWIGTKGGWKCEALNIPSSKIVDIYSGGKKIDNRKYSILNDNIFWNDENLQTRPESLTVDISVSSKLHTEKSYRMWQLIATTLIAILAALFPNLDKAAALLNLKATTENVCPDFDESSFDKSSIQAYFVDEHGNTTSICKDDLRQIVGCDWAIEEKGSETYFRVNFKFSTFQISEYPRFKFNVSKQFFDDLGGGMEVAGWECGDYNREWFTDELRSNVEFLKLYVQ